MFNIKEFSFASIHAFSNEQMQKILLPYCDIESEKTKQAFFIVGEKFSGKTTMLANMYEQGKCNLLYLNADFLASLNNIENYIAKNLVRQKISNCFEKEESFVLEISLSTLQESEIIKLAKSYNYNITMIYITTFDVQINIARLEQNENIKEIELQNLILKYENTRENLNAIKNLCDNYYEFDNSKEKSKE